MIGLDFHLANHYGIKQNESNFVKTFHIYPQIKYRNSKQINSHAVFYLASQRETHRQTHLPKTMETKGLGRKDVLNLTKSQNQLVLL